MGRVCPVCKNDLHLKGRDVIPDGLSVQWRLDVQERHAVNRREGDICAECGSSLRLIAFAGVVKDVLHGNFEVEVPSLGDIPDALRRSGKVLDIWECNDLSVLHPYLQDTPGLVYTQYASTLPEVPSEDLMALGFGDNAFDLILMTDVLEHVLDLGAALSEMARVLKPGGAIVLTVPVLMNRKTRQRAVLDSSGEVRTILEPSYHGAPEDELADLLVAHEFGSDVTSLFQDFFDVSLHNEDDLPFGANTVFVLTTKS